MTEQADPGKGKNWLGLAIGLLFSLIALVVLARQVNLEDMLRAVRLVNFSLFPLVLLFFICTLAARSFAWRELLQRQISWWKSFLTINEGYLFNNVLPFRLGEVARAFLLSQTTPVPFWEAFSTVIVERVFDMGLLAALLLCTVPFVIGAEWAIQFAVITAVLVFGGFIVMFLAARNQDSTLRLYERLTSTWPKLTAWGREKLLSLLTGLHALREPMRFIRVLFWMVLTWLFNITWYAILLWAFVPQAKLLWAAFAVGINSMGVSVPSSPGYIGVFEAAQVVALSVFGLDESLILAYAVFSHSLYLIITIAIGAFALMRDGQSLEQVYHGIRSAPKQ